MELHDMEHAVGDENQPVKGNEDSRDALQLSGRDSGGDANTDERMPVSPGTAPAEDGTGRNGKKKAGIIAGVAAAAVIAVAGGVFAFVKITQKDPKEVVIQAFENIYTEDQVKPVEELFGLSEFARNARTEDVEGGLTITLDSSSSADIEMYAGSGFKIAGLYDRTNGRSQANVGVVYKDMDLLHMDAYYGEDTLMAAVSELTSKVFSLDLSEGLAGRLKDSPVIGPMLEEEGIDIEGIGEYMEELAGAASAEAQGTKEFDLRAAVNRFQDGWQTREKLKEAITVEKAEKKTFVIDDAEVNCKGYQVGS